MRGWFFFEGLFVFFLGEGDGWIFLVSFFLFNLSFFTSSLLLLLLDKKFLIFLACVPGYLHLHAIFS